MGLSDIPNVSGLDTQAGLAYCGRNASIYARALRRFAALYEHGMPAVAETGRESLRREAHSLRGACSTIGAHELAEMAAALQRRCDATDGDDSLACAASLLDEGLGLLARRLHAVLNASAAST
jgi:HPt (histidine-containing phosphotransfer) domain-containing protein